MSKIAFLGLGAMGSRMAAHLLAAGHAVTVWNRNAAKMTLLRDAGAMAAHSPRAAVAEAEFVFAMVRDDEASRFVWLDAAEGALGDMSADAVAVECSTLSIGWVRELSGLFAAKGCAFLDAPVAGSRPQAEQKQLIFMVGGTAETLSRATPILSEMGAMIHHAGPNGAGAAVKLAVNALFGIQIGALGELIEIIRRQGFDPGRAVEIIAATPVCSPAAGAAAGAMLGDAFPPMFPVELAEKDFGYIQAAAGSTEAAPLTAAARTVFLRAMLDGYGQDNITGVVRLYRAKGL